MHNKPEGSFISYFSNLVKTNGGINLAQGIPGFQPPEALIGILKDVATSKCHQYAPGIGNFQLRSLVEQHYGVDHENLLIVQGATEGLSLVYTYVMTILGGSFVVLSFDPAYESYSRLPGIFGQNFIPFPLVNDEHVDFENLAEAIRQNGVKLVFISSPGNPFGKVWTKSEMDQLLGLSEQLNFFVVFDSVYEELYFSDKPYIPLDRLSEKVFIVSSFSKSLCITGWRVGYVLHHASHAKAIRAVHDYIGLCAPSVMQQALALYLACNHYGVEYMADIRQKVKESFEDLKRVLLDLRFTVPEIDGGCFIWAKLPEPFTDGFQFASDLYHAKGVAVIPGEHFSSAKVRWVRLNVARPLEEIILAGARMVEFVGKQ